MLSRQLGVFDATMVVISAIIGAGIFINPYLVARLLFSPHWILAAWVAGGMIAIFGALAYAELGSRFPRAGGNYVFLSECWHPLLGFLYGWTLLTVVTSGAMAAVAVTFSTYLLRLLPVSEPGALAKPVALAAIAVLTGINYMGLRPGRVLNNVLTVLKAATIVALVIAGLVWHGSPGPEAPALNAGVGALIAAFAAAMVPVLFSYGGWENLPYLSEEMRDPRRDLPRALVLGTAAVMVIYVAVNYAYLRVLNPLGLAATHTPAHDTAVIALGSAGGAFISVAIVLSTFAFLNLTVLAPPRVYYAMAADGLFFRWAARLHERYHVPARSIVLQSLWAGVLLLSGTYEQLVNYITFAAYFFFGLTVAGVFVLRRRASGEGGFRTPFYPVGPAAFVIVSFAAVTSIVLHDPRSALAGAALVLTGVPVFFFWRRNGLPALGQDEVGRPLEPGAQRRSGGEVE